MDCHPFLDWTNTSAVIAVIYWHATVISLHLNNKWHQNLCSSIIPDTPKVTEINPWIYTRTRSLNLCPIHLCPLYVFQIFSIILWSETSFLFFFNIHLVFFLFNFAVILWWSLCLCSLQISTCSLFEYAFFFFWHEWLTCQFILPFMSFTECLCWYKSVFHNNSLASSSFQNRMDRLCLGSDQPLSSQATLYSLVKSKS